jgi:hypothetical protein
MIKVELSKMQTLFKVSLFDDDKTVIVERTIKPQKEGQKTPKQGFSVLLPDGKGKEYNVNYKWINGIPYLDCPITKTANLMLVQLNKKGSFRSCDSAKSVLELDKIISEMKRDKKQIYAIDVKMKSLEARNNRLRYNLFKKG